MEHIQFDHARRERIGIPEAVFCEGKPLESLKNLLNSFKRTSGEKILFTRLAPGIFEALPQSLRDGIEYHALSRTARSGTLPPCTCGKVAVVSGGTCDAPVAWEAARTLEYLGIAFQMFEDCGVAGLWRIEKNLAGIKACDVIIVVAGLDAALATVLGGLCARPLFAVPTSVGYGAARHGETALSSMLASCAPGIAVLNIDNGYGAACAAARIIHGIRKEKSCADK